MVYHQYPFVTVLHPDKDRRHQEAMILFTDFVPIQASINKTIWGGKDDCGGDVEHDLQPSLSMGLRWCMLSQKCRKVLCDS